MQGHFPGLSAAWYGVLEFIHRFKQVQPFLNQVPVAAEDRSREYGVYRNGGEAVGFAGKMGFTIVRSSFDLLIQHAAVGFKLFKLL